MQAAHLRDGSWPTQLRVSTTSPLNPPIADIGADIIFHRFVPERDHVRPARATPAADVSVALTVDNGRGFNIPLTKDMWVAGDQASDHDKSDRPWAPGKGASERHRAMPLRKSRKSANFTPSSRFIQGIPG